MPIVDDQHATGGAGDPIERSIRVVPAGATQARAVDYGRTRSPSERLAETLKLHHEGNELFCGGNPPFVYCIEIRRVDPL